MTNEEAFIEWREELKDNAGGGLDDFSTNNLIEAAWYSGAVHAEGELMKATIEVVGQVCKIEFVGLPEDFATKLAEAFNDA